MGPTVAATGHSNFVQVDEESTLFFQLEPFTPKFVDELIPLASSHYHEIAHYQDIPLAPDWDAYFRMADAGVLRVFTARRQKTGELVGYCLVFVKTNPHYKTSLQAVQDVLYLDPAVRGRMVGSAFIQFIDGRLKEEGVQVMMQHVKAAHNFGPLLERLGYELVDHIYARRLDQ